MFLSKLLTGRGRTNRRTRRSDTPNRRGLTARRLRLESLEDRQLLSVVSGQVFNDLNADGAKNAGEAGQSGWTIYLDANTNGQFDTGETSTTTATAPLAAGPAPAAAKTRTTSAPAAGPASTRSSAAFTPFSPRRSTSKSESPPWIT